MKIKYYFFFTIIFLGIYSNIVAYTLNPNIQVDTTEGNIRDVYCYLTVGLAEPLAIGVGYQLNEDYSIGLKWGGYWLSGGTFIPNSGGGFGLRISKKTHMNFLNNINCELSFFHATGIDKSKILIKGGAIDINIGNEKNLTNKINFIWSIGMAVSVAHHTTPLYLPNIKMGFNVNF